MRPLLAAVAAAFVVAAPAVAQAPAWQTYRDTTLGFSAEFPTTPAVQTRDIPAGGRTVQMVSVIAGGDTAVYMVAVVDYGVMPENLKVSLDAAVSGMVSSVNGELLSQQEILVDGHAAREVVIRAMNGPNEVGMKVRIVANGTKLYEALAGGVAPGPPDADRFLASFRVL